MSSRSAGSGLLGSEPADASKETKCNEGATEMAHTERAHCHPAAIVAEADGEFCRDSMEHDRTVFSERQGLRPGTWVCRGRFGMTFTGKCEGALDRERLRLGGFNRFWSDDFLDGRIRKLGSEGGIGFDGI